MQIVRHIPSSIRIADEAVMIFYAAQPSTCRKCGAHGHIASRCRGVRCFNCEQPGHLAAQCEKPPLCGVCLEDNHVMAKCPFLLFNANVVSNATHIADNAVSEHHDDKISGSELASGEESISEFL